MYRLIVCLRYLRKKNYGLIGKGFVGKMMQV